MQAQAPAEVKIELFDEDSYVIIRPDWYTGLPSRYGVYRDEAIRIFAAHYCCRRKYRRAPTKWEADLDYWRFELENIGAKRIAPDVYELPFELTEDEKEYLKDLKKPI